MRPFRILIAKTMDDLYALADGWTIDDSDVRRFSELDNDYEGVVGVGDINVNEPGYVALAYK